MARFSWTTERLTKLRDAYVHGGMKGAMDAFPDHSRAALKAQLDFYGIRRSDDVSQPVVQHVTAKANPKRVEPTAVESRDASASSPARYAERLEPVPDNAIGLPWVSYPRDVTTLHAILDVVVDAHDRASAQKEPVVVGFFWQQAEYIRALIGRAEALAARMAA